MTSTANAGTPASTTLLAPIPFVGIGEIRDLLFEISKERVEDLTFRGDFPKPTAELAAGDLWLREEVAAWISQHGDTVADVFKQA